MIVPTAASRFMAEFCRTAQGMSGRGTAIAAYLESVPKSMLVGPLVTAVAALARRDRERRRARDVAQLNAAHTPFGWWALAAAFGFIPCLALALIIDAIGERLWGWDSPTVLGAALMLVPWSLAAWFGVRWLTATDGGGLTVIDDAGVMAAVAFSVVLAWATV